MIISLIRELERERTDEYVVKIQTCIARILIISLFFYILCIRSSLFVTSTDPCPLDVQVLYSDTSWCSGSYLVDNSTYLWDITTITFVTFGIANLDTITHSLDQFLLTIDETTDEGGLKFLKADNLTSEANFPLLLSPQRY